MNRYPCLWVSDRERHGKCPNGRCLDYDFCPEHMNTPRGRQHAMDVIAARRLSLCIDVEAAVAKGAATSIPEQDVQTTILEQMGLALNRVLQWEEEAKQRLEAIPEDEWRFRSRDGTEQARTELLVYERAMRGTVTALKDASRVAIEEKMVSLGKAQAEMMVRILNAIIGDSKVDRPTAETLRKALLKRLRREAGLNMQVQRKIEGDLRSGSQENRAIGA